MGDVMEKLKEGIIVSIQGYSKNTTIELAQECINAGAVALKTDKYIKNYIPGIQLIGCQKLKVNNPEIEAYLTPDIKTIEQIKPFFDFISIDYRVLNKNLKSVSDYCRENKINVIADIQNMNDYKNIKEHDYYYNYIASTFSVFDKKYRFKPNFALVLELLKHEDNIIAEGNFRTRHEVRQAIYSGIKWICIGAAITNVYKLTRQFTTCVIKAFE